MASISSPGLGSGLDINGIISKLMQVESQPLTAMAAKEASFQAKLSAFGALKGALASLQTAARTLATASTYTSKSAAVSDTSVFTASASGSAVTGSYNIAVNKLAAAEREKSATNFGTDTFGSGTLNITIGSKTTAVNLSGTANRLSNIRDAINAAGAGVTATIINDGYDHLVITSNTTGSAGAMTISAVDGSGGSRALSDLTADLVTDQAAQDAELTIDSFTITRSSNTITDAIEGITLSLLKADETTPPSAKLTVSNNNAAVTSAVGAFVKAYNDAINQLKSATAYDAANKKASVLTGDSTARNIQSQLSALVGTVVSGVNGGISRLSDIGISVQKDGTLATDNSKLSAALANPDIDVASLLSQTNSGNLGIGVRFNNLLEGLVGSSGLISSRTDGINTTIKDLQKRAEVFQNRLVSIERRYRAQFTALDSLVASMNQTSSYLSQQLANLPSLVRKD